MNVTLPNHLAERFRWVVKPDPSNPQTGQFVLYWMHNALRAHENPALDVSICLARQSGLPLLVYHALAEDYPYASDRHHAFILQGARDVQRELIDRGIPGFFHVQRDGHRGAHLRTLAREAAVVVTEEMPTEPISGWIERLATITSTPIACVDSSCVLPVTLLDTYHTRAFKFREASKRHYDERVASAYPEQTVDCDVFAGSLPFEPLDLQNACLASLIASCRIDHAVGPVAETVGGSRAGYRRWDAFRRAGLESYELRRNDAAIHDGTSRLSAYLHYGMVSPFRIAREAHAHHAIKFLDELLVWRELSFHYCFHNAEVLDSTDALPKWALESLNSHQADPRPMDLSWETLARAKSGQPLWDACQRSLLKHGELHNNVRMTWGKALLWWSKCPGLALQLVRDLNHRYALDARDPCSYSGILWCFGQFDRPFEPEQPILGTVRDRPIELHTQRINLKRFINIVDRPVAGKLPSIAIIGAGLGGLMAARTLVDHGIKVQVFEKSRGVGGRLATRRMDDGAWFDHGAQYFTSRDSRFAKYVQSWIHDGIVEPWIGKIVELKPNGKVVADKTDTPRYVGTPSMNHLAKHLATDLPIRLESRIHSIRRNEHDQWELLDENAQVFGAFDVVICNAPATQAWMLLDGHTNLAHTISEIEMCPCWSAMLTTIDTADFEFDGVFVNDSPLAWLARDNSKPGRHGSQASQPCDRWVLHASAEWSIEHLHEEPAVIQSRLVEALQQILGRRVTPHGDVISHLWRYAIPVNPAASESLWDAEAGLGTCGDWCGGPRVEGAFLSGMSIAGTILRHYTIDRTPALENAKLVQPSLLG